MTFSSKALYGSIPFALCIALAIILAFVDDTARIIILVILAAIILLSLVFFAFAAGNAWAAYLMRQGAGIALRAQESDDKRDVALLAAHSQAVSKLIPQVYKAGANSDNGGQLPPMLMSGLDLDSDSSSGIEDGEFIIKGLDQ